MKDLDQWNEQKKKIEKRNMSHVYFNEKEIWWCVLGLNIGVEEDGKQSGGGGYFMRPVLIHKKFNGRMIYILPISSEIREDQFHFTFSYRQRHCSVLLSQGRIISTKRLMRRIDKMLPADFIACKEKWLALFS